MMTVQQGLRSIFVKLIGGFGVIVLILVVLSLYSVNRLHTMGGYFDTLLRLRQGGPSS